MRLLLVSAYFEAHRGGVERVAGFLARGLAESGMAVTWLACDASPPPEPRPNLTPLPVPAWNGIQRHLGVPVPVWGPTALARMRGALREADAVMLHDTLYTGNIATWAAARRAGVPVMIVQHVGLIAFANPLLRGLMRIGDARIGRRMLATADQVAFISDRTAREFAAVPFRRPPETVWNGVDTAVFSPGRDEAERRAVRAALGLSPDRPVTLFAGRFVEKKGLPVVRALAARHPETDFVLAGWGPLDPGGWGLANVRTASARTPQEMRGLYRMADVFLLPSLGEGLPLVLQEALACGLPVLCSSETAEADAALARTGDHAPVDPADPEGTAAAWSALLARVLARTAAEPAAARRDRAAFAAERYSWPAAVARYRALLDRITTADAERSAAPPTAGRGSPPARSG